MENKAATDWFKARMNRLDHAHRTVDTYGRTDGADIDYSLAYSNVQTFGSEKVELKPAKVMTIYRMYLLLSSLNSNMFEAKFLSGVEELVVVADVVVINGFEEVRLPGIRRVVILCRVLYFKDDPHSPISARSSSILTSLRAVVADSAVEIEKKHDGSGDVLEFKALQFGGGKPTQLFVFAQGEIPPDGSKDNDWVCFEQGPVWREKSGLEYQMQVFPYRGEGQNDFAEKVKFKTKDSWRMKSFQNYPVKQVPGPSVGFVVSAKFKVPVHLLEDPHVVMGLQVLLLVAERILLHGQDAAGKDAVNAAVLHCKWLTTFVLPNRAKVNKDLQTLYVRAQGLLTLYASGTPKVLVPPLNYKLYRDSIEQVAVTARLYDQDLKATLHQLQIIKKSDDSSKKRFVKLSTALAAKEEDVEATKSNVLVLQNVMLDEAKSNQTKLKSDMKKYQDEMAIAKVQMDKDIQKYKDDQIVKAAWAAVGAVVGVIGAICSAGATSGSAFNGINEARDGLNKVFEVLEMMEKMMKAIEKLQGLINNESSGGNDTTTIVPQSPSNSDWELFTIDVERVVDSLPNEISGGKDWKAKCKAVAALGREICIVTVQVAKIEYDLKVAGWEKDIASKQRERLLSMDLESSDTYQDDSMYLKLKSLRMTNSLLEMLNIQNGALQYHYLQKSKRIPMGSTIYDVQEMLIHNDTTAVAFNEILGKSSELQIDYVLRDIPVRDLLEGYDFHFTISVEDTNFPASWQRVRIQYLTMKFTGPIKPETDTEVINLVLSGDNVFFDRYDGEALEYEAAMALHYPYAYNLLTGACTLQNREIPLELGNFMRMTPFSRWKLRVPKFAYENKNLRFVDDANRDAANRDAPERDAAKRDSPERDDFERHGSMPLGIVHSGHASMHDAPKHDARKYYAPDDAVTEITITFHMTLIRKIE